MRYLRFKELRKLIPLGRTTIWHMMREGRFPQSRRIGKAATAWLESEVEDWIKERALANSHTHLLSKGRPEYGQI
ncbi:MAG TPA: AlpA family phage regulatory protein [Acidobacteriota bacterium]|nr:AlpA family phage regulatory protein [Acidobacteriota bacterium]